MSRKLSNTLALAVLASLAERPMHPYELAALLRSRGKDGSIKIKWGSLYTVVQGLEKHGLIEATGTTRQGRRPERTVYGITPAGRDELEDWLGSLIAEPEREYPKFEAALSLIGALPPDTAIGLIRRRLTTLDSMIVGERATLDHWRGRLPRLFLIENEYHLAMLAAEAEWVRGMLAEIDSGEFPDIDAWRAVYRTGELPEQWAGLEPDAAPD